VGLAALGPRVVRLLLLPHAPAYCVALAPALEPCGGGAPGDDARRVEAAHVHAALAAAAAGAVHDLSRAWWAPGHYQTLARGFGLERLSRYHLTHARLWPRGRVGRRHCAAVPISERYQQCSMWLHRQSC